MCVLTGSGHVALGTSEAHVAEDDDKAAAADYLSLEVEAGSAADTTCGGVGDSWRRQGDGIDLA